MSSKFIISENDVVIVKDRKISRPYWRLAVVESIIVSKDNKVRGAKVRLPNSSVLERPINMLHPIEPIKINNTNKSYSPLEKDNEPEIDFVVNNRLFIKPGIQERGTECGERGECSLRFRGIS